MQYAKLHSAAKFNLASSGIEYYPLAEFPVRLEDLELSYPGDYGYQPLLERIARLNGVPVECVVTAAGTSMANHLAFAAALGPGEEALVEHPTYELLVSTLEFLGVKVRYFERRAEDGFGIDPEDVERNLTPQTRLIVITNLHNPTGALVDEPALRAVGEIARRHKARVLVDEVYLEMLYEKRPRPAFHLGEHFIVTSSLTKAYGLSGLRCGWVLASPELCRKMWNINDLFSSNLAHPAERLSVIALDHLERIAGRAKAILNANRPVLHDFLASRRNLAYHQPEFGTIVCPRLLTGSVEKLDRLLREKYETGVVPGAFFYMPQYFRVGIGGDPEMTRAGLERLALALDELKGVT